MNNIDEIKLKRKIIRQRKKKLREKEKINNERQNIAAEIMMLRRAGIDCQEFGGKLIIISAATAVSG